jgi:hypothetical protein
LEAKTAGRVNRKTTPFTACQSAQKGVDSSEARIIYEWLIFISPGVNAMQKQTQDMINQTIAFWSERSEQKCSQEDAREMVANVSGFFTVLAEWERRAKAEHLEREEVNSRG